MSIKKIKYKVASQNKLNLWNHKKLLAFKHKKWRWTLFSKKKEIFESIFYVSHRKSLRFLFKSVLRLKALLRFSRSVISSKQFMKLIKKLNKKTFIMFLNKLNTRLDYMLYNAGIIKSVFKIRQYVSHSLILVNNVPVEEAGYYLKEGDIIEFSSKIKQCVFSELYSNLPVKKTLSGLFEVNFNTLTLVTLVGLSKTKKTPYKTQQNLEVLNFLN